MAWRTYTERYEPVTWQTSKRVACPDCGKKVRRQKTFSQTVSPFNKNAEGQPKTELEITAELREQAAKWENEPERCTPCHETWWDAERAKRQGGAR